MHDLIIRGASVIDGLGGAPKTADLAVKDSRIAEIGAVSGTARETVDATGLSLMPGIIDVHTHYDAQLTWDPQCSPSPALGVTTVVIGNCGFGITPNAPDTRDTLIKNLSEVEGMSLTALRAGIDWRFDDFGSYLDLIATRGVVPNVAAFACHSSIRVAVLGDDASKRAATDDELDRMAAILRDALDAGAIGFASSTFENHNGFGGLPMPSRLAEESEFERLIDELGSAGRGLFMITAGERTTIDTLTGYSRRSGRPMVYAALLHNSQVPERTRTILSGCRAAQAADVPVYAQVSCQPLSMNFSLDAAYPLYGVDPWGSLPIDDPAALRTALADPDFRAHFRRSLTQPVGGRLFNGDWDRVEVAVCAAHPNYEGQPIPMLAEQVGADVIDFFFDLALSEDLMTVFNAKLLNVDEEAVGDILQHPDSLISLSDAGAHLTFFCDAGYGLHLLGHWVRERGDFEIGEAVRQITSRPAGIYGIRDRGALTEGAWADMLLFDPGTVGITGIERLHDLPAGQSRLVRRGLGVKGVWVNGVLVHDGDQYRDHPRPSGQVLTAFDA